MQIPLHERNHIHLHRRSCNHTVGKDRKRTVRSCFGLPVASQVCADTWIEHTDRTHRAVRRLNAVVTAVINRSRMECADHSRRRRNS